MHWHRATHHYATLGEPHVLATVLATSGSAPRPAGTKMLIAKNAEHDTLGGGQLEHLVIARARELLSREQTTQHIEHFPLAASALQCCGGSVTVLLECFATPALRIAVFGAGHIGTRVVQLANELSAAVLWFDHEAREPEGDLDSNTPSGSLIKFTNAEEAVSQIPRGSQVVIVSHDHQLDYALLEATLTRGINHFAGVGMIGSATKWQRFGKRLAAAGFAKTDIDKIRCPLGRSEGNAANPVTPQITKANDKQPMAIAIAIVNELLNLSSKRNALEPAPPSSLSWRQVKAALIKEERVQEEQSTL